jgi:dTDP-glucose pyrophosphorylase
VEIRYAYQELTMLPEGYTVPECRTKPWGTSHAVYCAREAIDGAPFAVINADDYYGKSAFKTIFDFLSNNGAPYGYCMVGYELSKTVTENGSVARGVCEVENGLLTGVTERTKIFKDGNDAKYTEDGETFVALPGGTIVSMNFWGFTPKMLRELDARFAAFLDNALVSNPLKGEYFLPSVVNDQLKAGTASVRVLPCEETWYGVTYREDLASVKDAIANMKKQGIYSENLWN